MTAIAIVQALVALAPSIPNAITAIKTVIDDLTNTGQITADQAAEAHANLLAAEQQLETDLAQKGA